MMGIRERLAELNSKDLRQYFAGFRQVMNELNAKKEELEVNNYIYDSYELTYKLN